jgi:hypothetical protein
MDVHLSIFELHLLRIAKFALGERQFIAAFNDGIYSVPSKCREINFTKQGGNKLPHSTERCHARKSKNNSTIRSDYLYFVIQKVNSLNTENHVILSSSLSDLGYLLVVARVRAFLK